MGRGIAATRGNGERNIHHTTVKNSRLFSEYLDNPTNDLFAGRVCTPRRHLYHVFASHLHFLLLDHGLEKTGLTPRRSTHEQNLQPPDTAPQVQS